MPWILTPDVEEFARDAVPLLSQQPVANTLVLGITDMLRSAHTYSDQSPLFGWFADHGALGAAVMTPPYEMILAGVRLETVHELVAALRAEGIDVPGVHADIETAERFAEEWVAGGDLRPHVERRQRLYRLEDLREPPHAAQGRPRTGRPEDVGPVVAWMRAFVHEVHLTDQVSDTVIAGQIAAGRLWIWDDEDGTAVAFAGRGKTIGGVARVGPVYTPPEHRGRGYGTAVTAACTADALAQGAAEVTLFTDLANPTSNSIYQRIGFRPVSDSLVIRFHPRP